MQKNLIFTLLLGALLWAAPAVAQVPLRYSIAFFHQGALQPLSVYEFWAAEVVCGQPRVAYSLTDTVLNPKVIAWDDPANPSLECRWQYTGAGQGPIYALPVGGPYDLVLSVQNSEGWSPASQRSNPFVLGAVGPPAALGNVRVLRP